MNTTLKLRRPVTSASNLFRRSICPGSKFLEAKVAETAKPEQDDDNSKKGTLLHDIMAGRLPVSDTPKNDKWAVQFADMKRKELLDQVFAEPKGEIVIERERTCLWPDSFDYIGTADLSAHDSETLLVIDYKFGRNPVEGADVNIQGRCYIVAEAARLGIKRGYFAIIQPYAEEEYRVQMVCYESDDFERAKKQIDGILASEDMTLHPSVDGCRYCDAALHCEACQGMAKRLAGRLVDLDKIEVGLRGVFLQSAAIISRIYENSWKPKAKALLKEDKDAIPGFKLRPGFKKLNLQDTQKVFDSVAGLIDDDVDKAREKFIGITKASISGLEELATEHLKKQKIPAKDATVILRKKLVQDGAAVETQTEDSIVEDRSKK